MPACALAGRPVFFTVNLAERHGYARHVDYIHHNPVQHGLVKRVRDWPHSTFFRRVRRGVYTETRAGGEERDMETGVELLDLCGIAGKCWDYATLRPSLRSCLEFL